MHGFLYSDFNVINHYHDDERQKKTYLWFARLPTSFVFLFVACKLKYELSIYWSVIELRFWNTSREIRSNRPMLYADFCQVTIFASGKSDLQQCCILLQFVANFSWEKWRTIILVFLQKVGKRFEMTTLH